MVGLYRDPEGKMVFSKTDPSQANMPPTSDQCTIDSLKRRVQELENEVTVIGACIYVFYTVVWAFPCTYLGMQLGSLIHNSVHTH